ncbi:probable G-protein coupled receptor 139 [Hemitrygon akajei]|uniref:probable G-protein coupled receptor 139 n=1 Tax=Hemitrygon akajei TaxID=2704970 RepID=UPI003BF9529C
MAIVILSRGKCGLSKGITCYMLAMAVADLMVVIIEVAFYQIIEAYGAYWLQPSVPFCLVHYVLCHVALDCSVWLTVAFTFDRFVAICWLKIQTKYCTPRVAGIVIGTICVAFCLQNVPYYFLHQQRVIIYTEQCDIKGALHMIPEFEWFYWVDRLLYPLLPFFLILSLNVLTVRQILASSRVRRTLRGHGNSERLQDPEIKCRRQSIVLLFTLSANFLICWATATLVFIILLCLSTELETSILLFLSRRAGTVLQLFSSCINTFIYAVTQTKFRQQLRSATLSPVHLLVKIGRKCKARS